MKPETQKKLQDAIEDAVENLRRRRLVPPLTQALGVGDVLVLPSFGKADYGFEWLVVNTHPDDANLILLVPVDTTPLLGVCDCEGFVEPLYRCRCGFSVWAARERLSTQWRINSQWVETAERCRRILAALARGQEIPATQDQKNTEADPNYEELIAAAAGEVAAIDRLYN